MVLYHRIVTASKEPGIPLRQRIHISVTRAGLDGWSSETAFGRGGRRADGGADATAVDVESSLRSAWNDRYRRLVELDAATDEVDLGPFVEGTAEGLRYHLAGRWFN